MGWSDCCIAASILYFLFFSLPEPVWILRWQAETPSSKIICWPASALRLVCFSWNSTTAALWRILLVVIKLDVKADITVHSAE